MAKAKVCMLTSGHSALDGRIFYKESRSLQQAGYEVTLIVPRNNEGFLVDLGGNRVAREEVTVSGIRIIGFNQGKRRIPKISGALRLARLASAGRFGLGPEPFADLINRGVKLEADIYHCHEIWSLYAGIQIKRGLEKKGKRPRLIYDVHEYPPAIGSSSNIIDYLYATAVRRATIRFAKEALKYTDYVITANHITRGYLLTLNRFIQTEVIYNCPALSIFQEPQKVMAHKDRITICHEGFLTFRRGLKQMIEVMRILKEHYGDNIELLIIGDVYGQERKYLEQKLQEYDLHGAIRCTGWLPYESIGEAISQADIGIIFFEPTENNMLAGPPHKLFNYMGCGLPVVSVKLPETSRVILETRCGVTVRDRNISSLAGALSALIDDEGKRRQMGENARKASHSQYSWEQMERRLLRVYEDLLQPV